ncbi:MAG: hypothetical protein WKF57_15945 [Nakamurella sp.]
MSITERRLTGALVALLIVCLVAAAATAVLLGRQAAVAARVSEPVTPSVSAPSTARPAPSTARPQPTATRISQSDPTPAVSGTDEPEPTSVTPASPSELTPTSASDPASVPSTAPTTAKPTGTVLDPPVDLSAQAAKHPDATAIQKLVSLNFRSINTLDYQLWADTVTPEQSAAFGPEDWLNAYRTSKDRDIEIVAIEPDTRWITITFNSSQAIDKAPPDEPSTCLNWKVVQPVVTVNGKLRLAKSVEGLSSYRGCE